MTENLANGYSYESAQKELSNEYPHDRVQMVLRNFCVLVLWMKVASALEGLKRIEWNFCIVISSPAKGHTHGS